jgi:outer membrane scaffolding protein for murein synthesis (MipA/OmpV family)
MMNLIRHSSPPLFLAVGGTAAGQGPARIPGLGINLIRSRKVFLTAGVSGNNSRPEDRADALAGMEDRRLGFSATSGLTYRLGPVQAGLSVSQGLRDHAGLSGRGSIGVTLPVTHRLFLDLSGNLSLANRDAMIYDFGVSPAEAQHRGELIASGDPKLRPGDDRAYRPAGGLKEIGGSASLMLILSSRWSLLGGAMVSRLSDAAARSSLVRRRTGWSGGLGFMVRP